MFANEKRVKSSQANEDVSSIITGDDILTAVDRREYAIVDDVRLHEGTLSE